MTHHHDNTGGANQSSKGRVHSPNFTRRAAGRNAKNEYPGPNRFEPVCGWKYELRGRAHLHALNILAFHLCVRVESEIKNEFSRRDYDPEYRSKFDSVKMCD